MVLFLYHQMYHLVREWIRQKHWVIFVPGQLYITQWYWQENVMLVCAVKVSGGRPCRGFSYMKVHCFGYLCPHTRIDTVPCTVWVIFYVIIDRGWEVDKEIFTFVKAWGSKISCIACIVEMGVCTSKGLLSRKPWLLWSWYKSDAYARLEAFGKYVEEKGFGLCDSS